MTIAGATNIHVFGGLFHSLVEGALQAFVQDFEFQHDLLNHAFMGPVDHQVGALAAQPVFPVDTAAGVDDPLQKCLQQELRAGLLVIEALHPVVGMLPEKFLERREQLVHVQSAVGRSVPFRFEANLVSQGIHQPRLALGVCPCQFQGFR